MISLYNNQENKRVKFKISIEGVDAAKVKPRLVLEFPDKSGGLIVRGLIENDVCFFTIPKLTLFEKNEVGSIFYEAIVEDEQYAKLWTDQYQIVSKTEIKVESAFEDEPVTKAKAIVMEASSPEFEDVVVKKKIIKPVENINEKEAPIEETKTETKAETKKIYKEDKQTLISDFYSFRESNKKE